MCEYCEGDEMLNRDDDWGCGEYHGDIRKRIAELEAELADWKELYPGTELRARAEKAEAEVERLRHLEGDASPSGVSPSPPIVWCRDCGVEFETKDNYEDHIRFGECIAARKERDDG